MKCKTFNNDFKANVAIETVKGDIMISELASEYGVHPTQINSWKKQLLTSVRVDSLMAPQKNYCHRLIKGASCYFTGKIAIVF